MTIALFVLYLVLSCDGWDTYLSADPGAFFPAA